MNSAIFSQAEKYIYAAEEEIGNGNAIRAGELLDSALSILGDQYVSPAVVDDTPMKLALANAKKKAGEFDVSVRIKKAIADSRLEMYKNKLGCAQKP